MPTKRALTRPLGTGGGGGVAGLGGARGGHTMAGRRCALRAGGIVVSIYPA